jgi:general secretion pathway protein F
MSTLEFSLTTVSPRRGMRTVRVHADDAPSARRAAEADGSRVLSCEPVIATIAGASARPGFMSGRRFDPALFAHELASLLDAGLGMVEAIETLSEKERNEHARQALSAVTIALTEGRTLSAAFNEYNEVFPPLMVACVSASEQTGSLSEALRRYAGNFEAVRMLRSKVVGAAIYPAVLLMVGLIVVMFLLGVVVPRFAGLIEGARGEVPFASRILLAWGRTVAAHPSIVLAVFAGVVAGVVMGVRRLMASGWNIRGLQSLPVIGPQVRRFRQTDFYRTSAMLVAGGVPVVQAFEMGKQLLTTEDQAGLERALRAIREGKPVAQAMQDANVADAIAVRMLGVAQKTGRLGDILARLASFNEDQLSRGIDAAAKLVEPLFMILIGLVIGAIVVLMYLPIFDLASSLQ